MRIDAAPDRSIAGRAASDVVRSDGRADRQRVVVLAARKPGHDPGRGGSTAGSRSIIDLGLGDGRRPLARANESLKSGGEVTIDTACRMGLFVVSRLAEEHGLKVKLRRNVNGGGIIASIVLPDDVLVGDGPVEHVSLMDAPEQVEEPEVLVEAEPEEEYDPYLERIEEAIAAVTGLPRRRAGVGGPDPEPVATPAAAAAVSMFEAPPAVAPAYEPVALPSQYDEPPAATDEPAATYDEPETQSNVFSPVFGGVRREEPVSGAVAADEPEPEAPAHEVEPVEAPTYNRWTDAVRPSRPTSPRPRPPSRRAGRSRARRAELPPPSATDTTRPGRHPATPVAEDEPVRERVAPADEPAYEPADDWGDNPLGTPAAAFDEPAAPAAETAPRAGPAAAPEVPLAPVAMAEPTVGTNGLAPSHRGTGPTHDPSAPSATPAAAALESDQVPDAGPPNTPIFGDLRSNWLNDDEADTSWTDNEDRGWTAGAAPTARRRHRGPHPHRAARRRPGGRLVPGGVSNELRVARDPDAIRNRLAAHAAGVSAVGRQLLHNPSATTTRTRRQAQHDREPPGRNDHCRDRDPRAGLGRQRFVDSVPVPRTPYWCPPTAR